MRPDDARWLVLDSETTGLDPTEHRLVELAAVHMRRGAVTDARAMLLDPQRPIPAEASAVHGISDAMVAGRSTLADVATQVCGHVGRVDVLVGYNVPFDLAFLDAHCPGFAQARAGLPILDPLVIVRTDAVGRFWKGAGRHRLGNVADRLGLAAPGSLHRARRDATLAGAVLWRLLGHLPADLAEASEWTARIRAQQEADFQEWLARQPAKEFA